MGVAAQATADPAWTGPRHRRAAEGLRPQRARVIALELLITLSVVIGLAASAPVAPPAEPLSVSVSVEPASGSTASGSLTLEAEVRLRSENPLDDQFFAPADESAGLRATRVDGAGPDLVWPTLRRVSGTPTDGVWRGSVTVTPAWAGSYRVVDVSASGQTRTGGFSFITLEVPEAPLVTLEGTPWTVETDGEPVPVVTGREPWTPRVTVRDETGTPVPGAPLSVLPASQCLPPDCLAVNVARLQEPPETVTDATGTWTGQTWAPTAPGQPEEPLVVRVYRDDAQGWTLYGERCVGRTEQWQIDAVYSGLSLAPGRPLTVEGNAWPAPSVAAAPNREVQLQLLEAGSWQTVAQGPVRDNGRYALEWTPETAGTYTTRVVKPGGQDRCGGSAGMVLDPVEVVVR